MSDEEVAAYPDANSATVLPWNSEIAWFASDLYLQGEPFKACCRGILKKVLAEAAEIGFTFNLGIETEFFILKETEDCAGNSGERSRYPCQTLLRSPGLAG